MRALTLLTLAVLALPALAEARPLRVHVRVGPVAAILVRQGILTPQQVACSELVPGRLGSRRVEQVSLYEVHGGRCPGTPQPPTYLFDVYVDRISGVVDYTPETNEELQTILPLPPVRLAE